MVVRALIILAPFQALAVRLRSAAGELLLARACSMFAPRPLPPAELNCLATLLQGRFMVNVLRVIPERFSNDLPNRLVRWNLGVSSATSLDQLNRHGRAAKLRT